MRRKYFTHPQFQWRFTFYFCIGGLITLGILGGVALLTLFLIAKSQYVLSDQSTVILAKFRELVLLTVYFGGILSLLLLFIGSYLSYKMVGPLYRLETWLETHLLGKNPEAIVLRSGDELEGINRVLVRLRSKFEIAAEEETL